MCRLIADRSDLKDIKGIANHEGHSVWGVLARRIRCR